MSNKDSSEKADFASIKHWSIFGRRGQAAQDRVQPHDGQTLTSIQIPKTAPWDAIVPAAQLTKLLTGFRPSQMEDKWFVYAEGPDKSGEVVVRMHRSWTGYENIRLRVRVEVDGEGNVKDEEASVWEIVWETDKERYRGVDEDEAKRTAEGVCAWVLGVELGKGEVKGSGGYVVDE
ncbi:hypothetical protein GGR57DRAFT_508851 [Xylariaceae sp. FL1272]|nr:hypothetical protein GGR57DRAFT_508851 [Xylariaceae sp. FL1272]